jgi:hypothetical protein
MVTDGVGHGQAVRDEAVARALVGMDKRKWYHKVLSFFGGVLGFIAGLATLLLVTVSCEDNFLADISAHAGQHVFGSLRFCHTSTLAPLTIDISQAEWRIHRLQCTHCMCSTRKRHPPPPRPRLHAVFLVPQVIQPPYRPLRSALRCPRLPQLASRPFATLG